MAESRGIDIRRESDGSLLFVAYLLDAANAKITTNSTARIWHLVPATGAIESYDFDDNTFKTTALTTPTVAVTHRTTDNATYNTGTHTYRHTTLTNFVIGDKYIFEVSHASLPAPQQRMFQYGGVEGDALQPTTTGNTINVNASGRGEALVMRWLTDDAAGTPNALVGGRADAATVIRTGTAVSGAAGYIELDAGASNTADFYNGSLVYIRSGTGSGQVPRLIYSYEGASHIATVYPNWNTAPDATSVFDIIPGGAAWGSKGGILNGPLDGDVDGSVNGSVLGDLSGDVGGNVDGKVLGIGAAVISGVGAWAKNEDGDKIAEEATLLATPAATAALVPGGVSVPGTVDDAAASTTSFITNLASATNNFYSGLLSFTSGALVGTGGRTVASYNGTTKRITLYKPLPSAPANGVTFNITADDKSGSSQDTGF